MNFHAPLLITDRGGVSIMSAYSQTRWVTHLMLDVARVVNGTLIMVELNIVESLRWDSANHEDL
jgi:hypothetical protein